MTLAQASVRTTPEPSYVDVDLDLARLGRYVLNSIALSRALGHVSTIGLNDYVVAVEPEGALLLDLLREADPKGFPEASARLNDFLANSDLPAQCAEAAGRIGYTATSTRSGPSRSARSGSSTSSPVSSQRNGTSVA